jgi:preprotein translocase subunit SecD
MRSRPIAFIALIAGLVAVVALALVALGIVSLPWADSAGGSSEGRLRIEYAVLPADGVAPDANDVSVVADIVRRRLESVGIVDGSVEVSGAARIAVEVPSVDDGLVVRRLVPSRGRLDFVPLGQEQVQEGQIVDLGTHPPLFGGDQIDAASAGTDQGGFATVDFTLRPVAAQVFGQYTATHIGDYFAITLDGRVLSAPVIRSAIGNGDIQIEFGEPDPTDARDVRELVAVLEYGSFPWPLVEIGTEAVPTASPSGG